MTHYVLFKFKPGISIERVLHCYNNTYLKMKSQLPEVESISFHENCINRDSNMDVMITVKLKSKDGLCDYLNHPLHLQFISDTNDDIINRVSFDCESYAENGGYDK